jgi:hypothetical protein
MRNPILTFSLMAMLLCAAAHVDASTIVPASQQLTVDSDGDSVPDLQDNAPGVSNNQADLDADLIGDVIDPTPTQSNPFLGDPALGVYAPPSILPGGSASFPYVLLTTPPGGYGQIVLDFDLDNIVDAVYFGPLSTNIDTLTIPASLFVGSTWDLYTPGTYTVAMKAWAPGMQSQNWAYPNVTVEVPEPASIALAACGASLAALVLRRKRRS